MQEFEFKLNNEIHEEYQPSDLESLEVNAVFDNSAVMPSIVTTDLTFTGKAATDIVKYIQDGKNGGAGIYEAMPYEIKLKQFADEYNVLKAILDFSDPSVLFNDTSIKCKLKSNDGLNQFSDLASALTFGYLEDQGKITKADYTSIGYVINYIPDAMQLILMGVSIYCIDQALGLAIEKLAKQIVNISTSTIPNIGIPPSINIGAIISAILKSVLLAAYVVALLVALFKMIKALIDGLYSPVRFYQGMKIKKLLEIGCTHLGLTFSSTVFDNNSKFKDLTFLPVKTKKGTFGSSQKQSGVPNSMGYGYTLFEMFELAMKMSNSKILIKTDPASGNKTLYLEPLQNLTFWQKNVNYIIPDVAFNEAENKTFRYNTDELKGSFVLKFAYDASDMNTIDTFKGTNYERLTNPIKVNNELNVLLKNLEEINFNVALGVRKTSLTTVEKILKVICQAVDTLTTIVTLGRQTTAFSASFGNRVGMLNLQNHFINEPKVLLLNSNNRLQPDHRAVLCAKYIYHNYYEITSFVQTPKLGMKWTNQFTIYKDYTIPFGFSDFLKVIENSWCKTSDGREAKIDKLTWNFMEQFAKIDYRVREPYTLNLKELFIEAD